MTQASITPSAEIAAMLCGTMTDSEILSFFQRYENEEITPEALASAAKAMRAVCIPVTLSPEAIDMCGTGGSGKKTINTSTLSAFIAAAAGAKVAKHGNRSASGNCGSFDLLEGIGAKIDLTVEEEKRIFDELGIVFLFARTHHPAMKHVSSARKLYGKPTIFNLLGPLVNPAEVRHQMIGTPDTKRAKLLADALRLLDTRSSLVVTGRDGLDEVTICDSTDMFHTPEGKRETFSPEDLGLVRENSDSITGGTKDENITIFNAIADGKGTRAQRNLVLINTAFALTLTKLVPNVQEGWKLAADTLDSGNVRTLITDYILLTNKTS